MIDFHSHILPGIDDGSANVERTKRILKEAEEAGFTKIISTSHYMSGYYESNEEERTELINSLKEETDITLYLGSEIYITENIVDLIKEKKASTMNNSKYVLFELPMNNKPMDVKEVVYKLIENGYVPVIAHPERYVYVQEDINFATDLADMGVLFQSNFGSIIGMYGKNAQKAIKSLLKMNLVHFMGTDVHRPEQVYPNMPKILKKLKKVVSEEKLEEITNINPQKVIDNDDIEL